MAKRGAIGREGRWSGSKGKVECEHLGFPDTAFGSDREPRPWEAVTIAVYIRCRQKIFNNVGGK